MKLVFFGSGAFGLPTLQMLANEHTLLAIVSQPDKPAGRGGKLSPTPIADWAAANLPLTPLLKPANVNESDTTAIIRAFHADAWVVIAFGQKLRPALLHDRFAINLHASLLPRWRGAAPINAAILAGDTSTGNSVITLADTMDAGLILAQSHRPIDPLQTAGELHDQLAQDGPALVRRVLADFASNSLDPIPQDESRVTLAKKLSKADAVLDFTQSAEECRRRIHALTPWPGITVSFRGEPIKLLRVRVIDHAAGNPTPATLLDANQGLVRCGHHSALQLLEVHPPGKRPMPWRDFANGRQVRSEESFRGGPPAC
jgi:methionyl-tRNA formyltransferase